MTKQSLCLTQNTFKVYNSFNHIFTKSMNKPPLTYHINAQKIQHYLNRPYKIWHNHKWAWYFLKVLWYRCSVPC